MGPALTLPLPVPLSLLSVLCRVLCTFPGGSCEAEAAALGALLNRSEGGFPSRWCRWLHSTSRAMIPRRLLDIVRSPLGKPLLEALAGAADRLAGVLTLPLPDGGSHQSEQALAGSYSVDYGVLRNDMQHGRGWAVLSGVLCTRPSGQWAGRSQLPGQDGSV